MKKLTSLAVTSLMATISFANADSIAYIGYGSLIEDPRGLPIEKDFDKTGPMLPIDFLRISGSYIGDSKKHDDTLYGALCDKEDSARKDHPLYLSVTIAPDEFANDVTPSQTYIANYDKEKNSAADPSKTDFDNARDALKTREGTDLSDNIAFISTSADAPKDSTVDDNGYKISKRIEALSKNDREGIEKWMKDNKADTVFVTYFESNFHDTTYGRGMESIKPYFKAIDDRDITQWNQDNIRLLMFLAANHKANISATRYDALEMFKNYLYEVPADVKNNTTYWQQGPYAHSAGLSGLVTDVFNYPRVHTRVLPDANAMIDCSNYEFTLKSSK